ncbi:GNAT family N-acetyltransferase [Pseudoalteromonas sp. T1lg22]|uniref:GNAT family N-acetyltransferase n=1 Tax=Pseudoalteromonas sp. T1lg22 TaxID=2077096 RepID=UPI00131A1D20|nr:GNAT family N-acetyltransferase [Pseudoalteromonas sp. T1lg22]
MQLDSFESSRLIHQPLRQAHWPLFVALHQNQEVMRYVADLPQITQIRERFDARLASGAKADSWRAWAILNENGKEIGVTGFLPQGEHSAELGFLLLPEYQGRGYGQESLQALLTYGERRFAIAQYRATVTAGNLASRALLLKCGFTQLASARNGYCIDGVEVEDWLFQLSL